MATDANIGENSEGSSSFGSELVGTDQGAPVSDQAAEAQSVQATPSDAAGTPPAAAQTQVWDGTQWTIKYRGAPVVPQSREELIKWAQYGHDATERNRQLSAREKELESRGKALEEYATLDGLLKQRPDLQAAIQEVVMKHKNGQPGAAQQQIGEEIPAEVQPYVQSLLMEIQGLKKQVGDISEWRSKADEKAQDQAIEAEQASLQKKYSDEDWTAQDEEGHTLARNIMKHAYENNFPTLEAAYRDYRWDSRMTTAKAEALKQAEQAKIQAQRAGIVSKGGVGSPAPAAPKPYSPRGKSWNQVGSDALNEALAKTR